MPIYEYQCEACGHQFDIIQKISDEKLTLCEKCNKHKLKKLVTAADLNLKERVGMKLTLKLNLKILLRKKLKPNQFI